MKVWLLAMLLLLAGCTDQKTQSDPEQDEDTPDGQPPSTQDWSELARSTGIPAPVWNIGDSFGHHFNFGENYQQYFGDSGDGIHIDVFVSNETETSYILDTNDAYYARLEAAYDMPVVGELSKDQLATTAYGGNWDLFQFPMRDGDSWQRDFQLPYGSEVEVMINATWNEAIDPLVGNIQPGFDLEAWDDEGNLIFTATYLPKIGWYGQMVVYEPFTDDYVEPFYEVNSMGTARNQETELYRYDDRLVLYLGAEINPEGPPAGNHMSPPAYFEIFATDTHILGAQMAASGPGTARADFMDPNQATYSVSVANPNGGFDFTFVDIPSPPPGEWGGSVLAASPFYAMAFVELFAMQEEVVNLGPAGAPLP